MTIRVNGEVVELAAGASVADAVALAGAGGETRGLAVALDGEVVPREEWEGTPLSDGQGIEVLRATQGG